MSDIDRTIAGVEQLYRSLTGHAPTNGEAVHEVIPPEVDPARYVELQLERLAGMLGSAREADTASPSLALFETPQSYFALLDLPGVAKDGVNVAVAAAGVLVEATRTPPLHALPEGATLRYREQPLGAYRRLVPLPPDARLDQVSARLADGALLLTVPRTAARRTVPVQ